MDIRFERVLRPVSIIVLFFFTWISIEPWNYAAWAQSGKKPLAAPKSKTTTEKFEESLRAVKKVVEDLDKNVASGKEITLALESLKGHKQTLESADPEIRAEFAATEKFLKEKKLPQAILDRQSKTVADYDTNYKTLKANLDSVIDLESERKQAETKGDRAQADKKRGELKARIKAAREHLTSKVKEPRHQKLDPNNLPHRVAKPTNKKPRLKKEQFTEFNKPIQLAYNGDPSGLLVAQNTQDLPTPADLAETIEVQFTPEIQAKAAELEHNPVKIYNWVRNNIDFVPTYGSIQGANHCLLTKQCNDMDTASLLIALLRTSGIAARYVIGTIEVPMDQVMNWVGGFTNPQAAINFIGSGGTPVAGLISGGKFSAARMEHTWVEAYVDYIPSRGAVHKQGDTWVPIDGSFKKFARKSGMDLYANMAFNGDQFMNSYIIDPQDITPYQHYGRAMLLWLDTNAPSASQEDVLGTRGISFGNGIIPNASPYFHGSLPYKVLLEGVKAARLSSNVLHNLTIEVGGNTILEGSLTANMSLPEANGKRLTLSYIPATASDESLVEQYGGDLLKVPPYLLNVKPVIKMDGNVVGIGGSIGMAFSQTLTITFNTPIYGMDRVQNTITAGTYSALIVQEQKTPLDVASTRMAQLTNNSENISTVTLDDLLGEFLYNIGLSYFHQLTIENDLYAKNFRIVYMKQISEAVTSLNMIVSHIFDIPRSVSQGGLSIDVDRDQYSTASLTGDESRNRQFMIISGMTSSAWEHKIFEVFSGIESVSAVKLLKYAHQHGITLHEIDSTNIGQLLPTLQVSQEVKDDVQNAINTGRRVMISQREVQYNDWIGVGYIALDPIIGNGAYMISGGLSGGGTSSMVPQAIREKSDFAAWRTLATRRSIVGLAVTKLETPYLWAGETPDCGFDCSGLVHYVFNSVYGNKVFPSRMNASGQHGYLQSKEWTYPESLKSYGDIVWRSTYQHTGIFMGSLGGNYVVHSSGAPCKDPEDPNGWLPSEDLPPECGEIADTGVRICGKYKRVVITTIDDVYFSNKQGVASDIGRPDP